MTEGHIGLRSITLLTFVLSAGFFLLGVCIRWLSAQARRSIQNAKSVGCGSQLLSYYMFVHDLVILPIPLSLILNETIASRGRGPWLAALAAVMFLAPALVSSAYLFSIPLCLFVFLWLKNSPPERASTSTHRGDNASLDP